MSLSQELLHFSSEAESVLIQIPVHVETAAVVLDRVLLTAEWLLRDVVLVEDLLPLPDVHALSGALIEVVISLQALMDQRRMWHMRGRPAIDIPEEQLATLLEHHFTQTDIVRLLQVSPCTIRRSIIHYRLEDVTKLSDIPDSQLDLIMTEYVHNNSHSGRHSYEGYLHSAGLHIQQTCVWESLRRVDSKGMDRRFRLAVHRRRYNVPMPNSLWHIDGHHKLIRWRIIVHGGIDGCSRLVYLNTSTNNKSESPFLKESVNMVFLLECDVTKEEKM